MFSLYYKKNDNSTLFRQLEESGFTKVQNYIPIYSKFFELNSNNYNSINLNNKYGIKKINETYDLNHYLIDVENENNESFQKKSFFKFSPILNPLKYLTGKYKTLNSESTLTPSIDDLNSRKELYLKKIHDKNNTSYVDGFFSYLSSSLLNNHKFIFGNDFYGSFICVQNEFHLNVYGDLDYLYQSEHFHKTKDDLFKLDSFDTSILDDDTRKYREKIKMGDANEELVLDDFDNDAFNNVFELTVENVDKLNEINLADSLVYEKIKNKLRTDSDLSSNSDSVSTGSNSLSEDDTEESEGEESEGEESEGEESEGEESEGEESEGEESEEEGSSLVSCSNSEMSEYSSSADENVNCVVYNFPVQIISMENMDETLDNYMENNEMSDLEWKSCLIQVLFILITYQNSFDFTHNDLHTNNIMYNETDRKYLYIKCNKQYYKVPTFGKIFKIIDFGRSIYKFNGKQLCCDSYSQKEDAGGQYNFEPFKNNNKPELLPNKSFDLCRLGCSLYDYFIDDFRDEDEYDNEVVQLIIKWTRDDKNRNILYKKSGEERYPEFKLYKMIARTVHHCEPHNELNNELFNCFKISRKEIKKKQIVNLVNIDNIPCYV
jgi:hypothetical protein